MLGSVHLLGCLSLSSSIRSVGISRSKHCANWMLETRRRWNISQMLYIVYSTYIRNGDIDSSSNNKQHPYQRNGHAKTTWKFNICFLSSTHSVNKMQPHAPKEPNRTPYKTVYIYTHKKQLATSNVTTWNSNWWSSFSDFFSYRHTYMHARTQLIVCCAIPSVLFKTAVQWSCPFHLILSCSFLLWWQRSW